MQGHVAAAVTRSLLPVCRDFPVVHPLRFRGLTLQLPPAVCVRLRLPCAPCASSPYRPAFYGGTAPPGVAEYVNNGGKHHAICETCHSERKSATVSPFYRICLANDFLYAEAYVYALAQKMMPEYQGGFWHFIRLPDGGGYMMPDGDRFQVNGANWFDRTRVLMPQASF